MSLSRTRTNGRLIKHCSFLRTVILSSMERFATISIGYIWFFPNNFPRSRLRRDCTLPSSFLLARRLTSLKRGNKFILSTSTSLHFSQPFLASRLLVFIPRAQDKIVNSVVVVVTKPFAFFFDSWLRVGDSVGDSFQVLTLFAKHSIGYLRLLTMKLIFTNVVFGHSRRLTTLFRTSTTPCGPRRYDFSAERSNSLRPQDYVTSPSLKIVSCFHNTLLRHAEINDMLLRRVRLHTHCGAIRSSLHAVSHYHERCITNPHFTFATLLPRGPSFLLDICIEVQISISVGWKQRNQATAICKTTKFLEEWLDFRGFVFAENRRAIAYFVLVW